MSDALGGRSHKLKLRRQVQQGIEQLKADDIDAAEATFAAILEDDPNVAAAHLGLGRIHFLHRDLETALEHFQQAVALNPDSSLALTLSARVREQLGDADRALEDYEEASRIEPGRGLPQIKLSRAFAQQERHQQAVERLKEALRYNPQQVPARILLASLLEEAGDLEGAKSELQKLLELRPELSIANYKLGRLYLRERDYAKARPLLERAVAQAPAKAGMHRALGAALSGLGDHKAALVCLREAQRLSKNPSSSVANSIADCHIALGQPETALKVLQEAVRRSRTKGVVYKRIGDVLLSMGRFKEALESYQAAVLGQPKFVEEDASLKALISEEGEPEDLAKSIQAKLASLMETRRADATASGRRRLGGPTLRRRVAG